MSVYFKFKSEKNYYSVPIDGRFISVGDLKKEIIELKYFGGTGKDYGLIVTNTQTNEEYLHESMLIPRNTSVLICRVPGLPCKPIVIAPVSKEEELNVDHNIEDVEAVANQSSGKYDEDMELDDFGDLYAMPESTQTSTVASSFQVQDATPVSNEDEESKIKALIDTQAIDWQRQLLDGFNPGRGFGRGRRIPGGRGFGRGGFENKTPPQGYVCHRCNVPGHFIQHCPTNGDTDFDIRRVKPPTGIPKSMLMATPDGSYALPSGHLAVLKPNQVAFQKEIEGIPSTQSIRDFPKELHCPICQEVMKDAVMTRKCCYKSFCDKCIHNYLISKSMCECGAPNILADDLAPNKTLRDIINHTLESNNYRGESGGSAFQAQDMESRNPLAKFPSPTQSTASKGQQPPPQEETSRTVETDEETKPANVPLKSEKVADASEATHDSRTFMEAASQGSAPLADEEVQHESTCGEAGPKKKKKKIGMAPGGAETVSMGPCAYYPAVQPGFDMCPQSDLSALVGYNAMSRNEFETRGGDLKRKRGSVCIDD